MTPEQEAEELELVSWLGKLDSGFGIKVIGVIALTGRKPNARQRDLLVPPMRLIDILEVLKS
jgi:hypothetical protein